ncbi:MAG: hypothetical protein H7Z40_12695 [Phycisphaerae bacterium]|nr:hypothetical protein [Gemmatimonadaceae bacterium]
MNSIALALVAGVVLALSPRALTTDIPVNARSAATETRRVVIDASDAFASTRWTRNTVYELSGTLTLAPHATLEIEPGTRVESTAGTSIVVPRSARIVANGTPLEPVVFTCKSAVRFPGCWVGLIVHGSAPINAGQSTSPPARGNGQGGCLEQTDSRAGGLFGGCDAADSSGVLRYVRIEYAEQEGLRLAGVGSGTVIDYLQVNRGLSEGISLVGGTANLRHTVYTANGGSALRWTGGWTGKAQYLLMQVDPANSSFGAGAIRGENGPNSQVNNTPRSAPHIFNLSVLTVGGASPGSAPAAITLARGSAGTFRNVLMHRVDIGVDIDDAATCDLLATGALSFSNSMFAGAGLPGDVDADPANCSTYASPNVERDWFLDAANSNQTVSSPAQVQSLVKGPGELITFDGRPMAALPSIAPPNDGWFDTQGNFLGALSFASTSPEASIPWHSGWTAPAPSPPIATPGNIIGRVFSSQLTGAFVGTNVHTIRAPQTVQTIALGLFTFGSAPVGPNQVYASNLPAGCNTPDPVDVFVPVADTAQAILLSICGVPGGAAEVTAGLQHTCALSSAGTSACWGYNLYGQIGDGTNNNRTAPTTLGTPPNFASLFTGLYHSCGLNGAGQAYCWGWNPYGQLGDGTTGPFASQRRFPIAVSGSLTFSQLALGAGHTCGLDGNSRAHCWGENGAGQLGDSSSANGHPVPGRVKRDLTFGQLVAGLAHTCGLTPAGQAWCWGGNGAGQIGDGTFSMNRQVPVPVSGGHIFSQITGGREHTCGLKANGQAWCWGANVYGQVGNTGSIVHFVPVPVSGGLTFAYLDGGTYHTCGITTAGTSYCWGANYAGQLGNGTDDDTAAPQLVGGGHVFSRISAGGSHSCGITSVGGAIWCWGDNSTGQLGLGSTTGSFVPVRVSFP